MAQNPELEALINGEPDNPAHYRIYADWLQSQGDVRGELIVLQMAGAEARSPEDRASRQQAERAVLQAHSELRGPAAPGFNVKWRWGFARSLAIPPPLTPEHAAQLPAQVRTFLRHPSFRFLRHLKVEGGPEAPLTALFQEVGESFPPTLDQFEIWQRTIDAALLEELSRPERKVRQLSLSGLNVPLERLTMPELRLLEFQPLEMTRDELRALARAQLPKLESLRLNGLAGDVSIDDLELAFNALSRLHVLYVGGLGASKHDVIFEGIGYSKLTTQLRELRLGIMNAGLAEALERHYGLLSSIPKIRIAASIVGAARKRLTELYGTTLAFDQRDL